MWERSKVLILTLAAGCAPAAFGCSEDPGPLHTCVLADLCAQVTVERVTATCGTSAMTAVYDSMVDGQNILDSCAYAGPTGQAFSVNRGCFQLSSSAQMVYSTAHGDTVPTGFLRADVDEIGDRAFFQYSTQNTTAQLLVLSNNLFVAVVTNEPSDATATKSCLMTIANDVLVAQ